MFDNVKVDFPLAPLVYPSSHDELIADVRELSSLQSAVFIQEGDGLDKQMMKLVFERGHEVKAGVIKVPFAHELKLKISRSAIAEIKGFLKSESELVYVMTISKLSVIREGN